MNTSNPVLFRNGNFYSPGDDGQLHPVHEILKIQCGQDFGKCARHNTSFPYDYSNAGYEKHGDFWRGREFHVLMVPGKDNAGVVWVRGEVVGWEE